eukprot:scaffold6143_cov290-Pinguiococcus_pyrenoidosus.AAC.1
MSAGVRLSECFEVHRSSVGVPQWLIRSYSLGWRKLGSLPVAVGSPLSVELVTSKLDADVIALGQVFVLQSLRFKLPLDLPLLELLFARQRGVVLVIASTGFRGKVLFSGILRHSTTLLRTSFAASTALLPRRRKRLAGVVIRSTLRSKFALGFAKGLSGS